MNEIQETDPIISKYSCRTYYKKNNLNIIFIIISDLFYRNKQNITKISFRNILLKLT